MRSIAATLRSVRVISKSEGCGAPSGRVLFLVGSLSAPRLAASLPPLSPLTTCSAGLTARRYGPESSNSGGGEEAARGGPLLRPRGLIATRSRKWLPPLAVVLERRGPTPHDRDGLGHASLMGQGWGEFSAGVTSWQFPTPASQERRRTSPQGGGMESCCCAMTRHAAPYRRGAAQRPAHAAKARDAGRQAAASYFKWAASRRPAWRRYFNAHAAAPYLCYRSGEPSGSRRG